MNLLSLIQDNFLWIIIGAFVVIIVLLFVIFRLTYVNKQKKHIVIKDGIRYEKGVIGTDVSYIEGDVILAKDLKYIVEKNAKVIPGKYVILSSVKGIDSFNVRYNGIVKELKHNSDIVLNSGDEIVPVSQNIILR